MPQNESILDFLAGNIPDQSQTLTGGSVEPAPLAKDEVVRVVDSVLKALAGPHTQIAEDIAKGKMPKSPESFAESLGLLPMANIGGVRIPPGSADLGGRQLRMINEVENWLNSSNIEYSLNMNRSNSNSVYIYARHPHTGESVAIRVPRDGHIGFVDQRAQAKYKETNRPGNFFDTGHTFTSTNRPIQPEYTGNVAGEPYYDLDTLFDALTHRFSRNPSGQFLVPPGREPHYPSERLTPIPMTNPPMMWGTTIRNTPPPPRPPTLGGHRRVVLPPRRPTQLEFQFR